MTLLRTQLGNTLRGHRLRQRRTLRDVSGAARVSLGYLSEVERGQKEASSELLASICDALDVELADLLAEVSLELRVRRRRRASARWPRRRRRGRRGPAAPPSSPPPAEPVAEPALALVGAGRRPARRCAVARRSRSPPDRPARAPFAPLLDRARRSVQDRSHAPATPVRPRLAGPAHLPGAHTRSGNAMGRTRPGLLAGAARAFAEHGVRRSTMQSIAAAAGVAKATLYNHFRTKDEVAAALLAAELDRLTAWPTGLPLDQALAALSDELGAHPVLRRLAETEPEALAGLLAVDADRWAELTGRLAAALRLDADGAELAAGGCSASSSSPAGRRPGTGTPPGSRRARALSERQRG